MQEKTLLNQANSTSNIHSGEFGSVSYDIFGSPYQKSCSFLADDSLNLGVLAREENFITSYQIQGGIAIHQANPIAKITNAYTEGCVGVSESSTATPEENYEDLLAILGDENVTIYIK